MPQFLLTVYLWNNFLEAESYWGKNMHPCDLKNGPIMIINNISLIKVPPLMELSHQVVCHSQQPKSHTFWGLLYFFFGGGRGRKVVKIKIRLEIYKWSKKVSQINFLLCVISQKIMLCCCYKSLKSHIPTETCSFIHRSLTVRSVLIPDLCTGAAPCQAPSYHGRMGSTGNWL